MKKRQLAALFAAMALWMTGCGGSVRGTVPAADAEADKEAAYFDEISDYSRFVTLGDYQHLSVTLPALSVDEAAVEEALMSYAMQLPGVPVTGRDISQTGDQLLVDYSGRYKEDDTVFDGGTAQGQTVTIGGAGYIPGFAEGMADHRKGETFEMEVTFPEDYGAVDLQGKEVIFTVTIHEISAPPELTDDNVGDLMSTHFGLTGITSLDDLRAYIRDRMLEDAEASNAELLHDRVVEAAMDVCTFEQEAPEKITARYEERLSSSVEQQAYMYQMYGYDYMTKEYLLEQIMAQQGFNGTAEDFLHETAVEQTNSMLMFFAIAKAEEGLMPTQEEVGASVEATLAQNGFTTEDEYEEAAGYRLTPLVTESLTADNVLAYLEEHAEITYE